MENTETNQPQSTSTVLVVKEETAETRDIKCRTKQINALAMKGTRATRSKDSWRKTVGKYAEDAPLNRMLDRGAAIREAERGEEC
jgi:hypothetical protein